MKKFSLLIGFILCILNVFAQQDKAFTLPKIWGTVLSGTLSPAISSDGKKLSFGISVIDPKSLFVNIFDRDLKDANTGNYPYSHTYCLSPDLRYRVINHFNVQEKLREARAGGWIMKERDWVSFGGSPADTSWHFSTFEDNYALAINDAGEVICSKPSFQKKSGAIKGMKGIWLYNPKTGVQKMLSSEQLFNDDYYNTRILFSTDRKKLLVTRSRKASSELLVFDLVTGASHIVPITFFHYVVSAGNDIALVKYHGYDNSSPSSEYIISLADGRIIMPDDPAMKERGSGSAYGLANFYLSGNSFYYMDPDKFTVTHYELENDHMVQQGGTVALDTNGLHIAKTEYSFAVLEDYYALWPLYKPTDYDKPYPLFLYFLSRDNGAPKYAVQPFFQQPYVEPSQSEIAYRKETEKRMQDSKCERLKAAMPFPVGALLRDITYGNCDKPEYIFGGVDCERGDYIGYKIHGYLPGYSLLSQISNWQRCDQGLYTPCERCGGVGKYDERVIVADDGWKQTNFNVYVRDPNATKAVTLTHTCEKCKGKGYYKL